jgi:hypothetical protein
MVPPKWDAQNWKEWIGGIGQNYAGSHKRCRREIRGEPQQRRRAHALMAAAL